MNIPRDVIDQLLRQEEVSEEVNQISKKIRDKYEAELGLSFTGTLDAMQKELFEKYGTLFTTVDKIVEEKIKKTHDDISSLYGIIYPLPDSCYEFFYAEMAVCVKAFIDVLHEVNKKSGLLSKLHSNEPDSVK